MTRQPASDPEASPAGPLRPTARSRQGRTTGREIDRQIGAGHGAAQADG